MMNLKGLYSLEEFLSASAQHPLASNSSNGEGKKSAIEHQHSNLKSGTKKSLLNFNTSIHNIKTIL